METVNAAKGMVARELGEADQRAQTSRDKMNRFWGPNIQHGDHSQQQYSAYLKT